MPFFSIPLLIYFCKYKIYLLFTNTFVKLQFVRYDYFLTCEHLNEKLLVLMCFKCKLRPVSYMNNENIYYIRIVSNLLLMTLFVIYDEVSLELT